VWALDRLDTSEISVTEWTANLEEPLYVRPDKPKYVVSAKVAAEELAMFKRAQKILD
jgi:hypothetical protein